MNFINTKTKKIWLNIIVVIICMLALIIWIVTQKDLDLIAIQLKYTNYGYLTICIVIILISMITDAMSLHVIIDKYEKISFFDSINIAISANFYNGITPFASGGQPFQIYYYSKLGIKAENSTSALVMNFIVHQACVCIFAIVAIIFYYSFLKDNITNITIGIININFTAMVIIGFSINLSILVILILMSTMPKFKRLAWHFIDLFRKFKFLTNRIDKVQNRVEVFIHEFQYGSQIIGRNIGLLLTTLLFKIVSMIAYFIIPFFIFDAIGIIIDPAQIFFILCMSTFAFVLMSWMPTPGASGAAEWGFSTVFILIPGVTITTAIAVAATLLWRFFTYYLRMFFGFISVLLLNRIKRGENDEDRVIHG